MTQGSDRPQRAKGGPHLPGRGSRPEAAGRLIEPRFPVRVLVWAFHLAIPLLALWLFVARPAFDLRWENHVAHFWLVLIVAAVNLVLAASIGDEAVRRDDARLFLVSMAFATSAGFLALHSLATPAVLVGGNTGFVLATPVGLLLTGALAAVSSVEFSVAGGAAVMRWRNAFRAGLAAVLIGWLAVSVLRVVRIDAPVGATELHGYLLVLMAVGSSLYLFAAARYYRLHRRRPSVMLISLITAFILLAEAMVSAAYARNWQASWWEWHVLMALGFAFVAYSAYVQWAREGSATGLFGGIALAQTVRNMREEYAAALEAMVTAMQRREEAADDAPIAPVAARLGERFELSERQVDVLIRAAEALANERDLIRRQRGLVAVGREVSVIREEHELMERVLAITGDAFAPDVLRVALLSDGRLRVPDADREQADAALRTLAPVESAGAAASGGASMALPLMVKGHAAGVLQVARPRGVFADRDRSLLLSFASQLSIALENARLYRQIDVLFRTYMSPDVATSLLADPDQAALGGAIAEVTVLMADLRGFTPFSERTTPDQVVSMLNTYFSTIVPIVLDCGGTVIQFVGDALMAVFNAPTRQRDHALRAARAGLTAQAAAAVVSAGRQGWPRFRIGISTGPALVGNIGAEQMRNYTAIGDTTNLAARLETSAQVGEVVIGAVTYAQISHVAVVEPLGRLELKGKSAAVEAYRLVALREPPQPAPAPSPPAADR